MFLEEPIRSSRSNIHPRKFIFRYRKSELSHRHSSWLTRQTSLPYSPRPTYSTPDILHNSLIASFFFLFFIFYPTSLCYFFCSFVIQENQERRILKKEFEELDKLLYSWRSQFYHNFYYYNSSKESIVTKFIINTWPRLFINLPRKFRWKKESVKWTILKKTFPFFLLSKEILLLLSPKNQQDSNSLMMVKFY